MRKLSVLVVALAVVLGVVLVVRAAQRGPTAERPTVRADGGSSQEAESRSEAEGEEEEGEEAFAEGGDPDADPANHVGTTHIARRVMAPTTLAATGWAGEVQVANEDTWEPYVAADPSAPFVYAMYNRYGITCKRCPNPQMEIRISSDGGSTWAAEKPMCTCTGVSGQWDPVLATTSTGTVYGTWMNSNTIVFSKSTNHGATWTTPLQVSANSWADKPWMATSANGSDIYIAYESRSQLFITSSHNGGASFSAPVNVNTDSSVYRYPNGFVVLANGTAILSDSKYNGGSVKTAGPVEIEGGRSTNGGAAWDQGGGGDTGVTRGTLRTPATTT